MSPTQRLLTVLSMVLALFGISAAQTAAPVSSLPHVIKYSGFVKDAPAQTVGVIFAIYDKQDSVSPIWLETQSVTTDDKGHYTVILGATKEDGLPASIFANGEGRWIG